MGETMLASLSASMVGAAGGLVLVVYIAFLVLFAVAWVKILSKAGYSGWWVLIGVVPIANLVMFFVFAFAEWPVLRGRRYAPDEPAWPPPPPQYGDR